MKALPEKKRQNKQTKVRMQNALVNASRSENLAAINQKNPTVSKGYWVPTGIWYLSGTWIGHFSTLLALAFYLLGIKDPPIYVHPKWEWVGLVTGELYPGTFSEINVNTLASNLKIAVPRIYHSTLVRKYRQIYFD